MKLSQAKTGDVLTVTSLAGDERFISRTSSMGIIEGSVIEVLQNAKRQPMLICCRDTMIAINRAECEKIETEVRG